MGGGKTRSRKIIMGKARGRKQQELLQYDVLEAFLVGC
jgi:hypothetical protein